MSKYEQRGVSTSKIDIKNAVQNYDMGLYPLSFCKVIPDVLTDSKKNLFGPSYCNIMHNNGAGTKAVLAYLYWKETGDISVWRGIAQDAIVMSIDDMVCTGATDNFLLTTAIKRNRFRIPGEVIAEIISGTQEFIQAMGEEKIHISHAGGETHDIGDVVKTILVDSTLSTRIKRNDVLTCGRIQPGDVIIGLASFGKTRYEKVYNSGIGSTGFASARHDVLSKGYAEKYPETYDSQIPNELVFSGSKNLTDPSGVDGLNIGQLLLSPARTYAPVLKSILENFRPSLHGVVHCSGGGQTKVLEFVKNIHIIKDNLFSIPPVFSLIQQESGTLWEEMYSTFNMGHRMEIYVKENIVEDILKICQFFDLEAKVIGHCEDAPNKTLTVESTQGKFIYCYD
ncbi:MAG: phosphoribosylformylglycinamidine cyclo-ligase [Bacteroidales bacterium]|jgi:phosphoribosylformylglycinamidine cyclo-ligase|nr:phosphoribosylformylglycinamidine cyclo-ligase [Bacteroidales bacterium]